MEKVLNMWLDSPNVSDEDKQTILAMNHTEKQEAFYKDVEFGTAGMRGLMGVGTNRINDFTIARATQAFAEYINARDVNKRVAIAYDNRNNSRHFANISAQVLAHNNIEVYIYDEVMATPLLSYAVRQLDCGGGINITASHNPKEYNGFKVYDETGSQLVTRLAKIVVDNVSKLDNYLDIIKPSTDAANALIHHIDKKVVEKYTQTILNLQFQPNQTEDFHLVYSPQHGAGVNVIPQLLDKAGYHYSLVKEQATLDGNFSNTESPNPEDKAAYTLALKQAKVENADMVVTSDPDADRLGVAIKHNGEYILLNGNETTSIMLEYILKQRQLANTLPQTPFVVNTIVTSDLGSKIAQSYGATMQKTLTGFKNIGSLMEKGDNLKNYVFGYEESYGSLPFAIVRDKDAVSATLLLAEMGSQAKKQGLTLVDVLNELYKKHGYHIDTQQSITMAGLDGPEKIAAVMAKFYEQTIGTTDFGDIEVIENYATSERIDAKNTTPLDFEKADVFKVFFKDMGWIAIRPSGTEPKIKVYYGVTGKDETAAQANLKQLEAYVRTKID